MGLLFEDSVVQTFLRTPFLRRVVWFCAIIILLANDAKAQTPVSFAADPDRTSAHYDKIDAALAKPCIIDYVDTPLKDVMANLADQSGVTFVLTRKLEDAGVQPDQPVTRSIKNLSLKSALRLMLNDLNLSYMVRNECIVITTKEDAQSPENMETRAYPVKDLLETFRLPAKDTASFDFDPLVELITSSIEPDSWQDVGGPGSISGSDAAGALLISTRRDLHDRVAGALTSLRRAKSVQGLRGVDSEPTVISRPYAAGASSLSRPLPASGGRK